MASCRFCLNESCDSWYSNYCAKCHKLQRVIHLFTIDKVMNIIENVLIVDEETQKEKVKDELKTILTTREYNLRKKKEIVKELEK
jgi:hypothetical protein